MDEIVLGIDGCPRGWVAAVHIPGEGIGDVVVAARFAELEQRIESAVATAVDIPIGLTEHPEFGGRACDRAARRLLGRRGAAVFTPPTRPALGVEGYWSALAFQRERGGPGFSRQAWNLRHKLREIDDWMTPARQEAVKEVHPEVSFMALNDGVPLTEPKRREGGRAARLACLERAGLGGIRDWFGIWPRKAVGVDDLLDAAVAAWTAARIARGEARIVPEQPACDREGLEMAIRY